MTHFNLSDVDMIEKIRLEQNLVLPDPEAVLQCPCCGEDMEMGLSAESVTYPNIQICYDCADREERFARIRTKPIQQWFFSEVLRTGVQEQ